MIATLYQAGFGGSLKQKSEGLEPSHFLMITD